MLKMSKAAVKSTTPMMSRAATGPRISPKVPLSARVVKPSNPHAFGVILLNTWNQADGQDERSSQH
jgi:hypothetical protein